MAASPPPPDRFQREIDDIVRLAEKRLERQSPSYRVQRSTREVRNRFRGLNVRLPPAETLAGWGFAFMLVSWLAGLVGIRLVATPLLAIGVALLAAGLILSLTRGRTASNEKMWRGERVEYGSAYGSGDLMRRIRQLFRGR